MGTLQTPDGPERIRGALVLEDPYRSGEGFLVVVANSPLACEADRHDDQSTVRDEAAEAQAWWADSLDAAAKREGAVVVSFFLASLDDEQVLSADANDWAAYRVIESGWVDGERVVYDYELDQRGTGRATGTRPDERFEVDFEVEGYAGRFTAEGCDEPELVGAIIELYASI